MINYFSIPAVECYDDITWALDITKLKLTVIKNCEIYLRGREI